VHHNVFFSDDYRAEFDDLRKRFIAPRSPTVYVCAQDRADRETSSAEKRALVIVNAPASGDEPQRWTDEERERCTETMMNTLSRCGLTMDLLASRQTTPVEWHARFPQTGGALYGPIARGSLSAFRRQGARTAVRGLYVAGGSAHPGPGVPMAALSGRLAASAIIEDHVSTASSRRMGIAGTTSME